MNRRYAWILNLDAELELARGRPGYVPATKLLTQLSTHGASARDLLGPHDLSLGGSGLLVEAASPRKARELAGYVGRAWCPTPRALAALRAAGVEPEAAPAENVLKLVYHRRFAHELGGGLPEQRYLTEARDVLELARDGTRTWLLKRPLTFAGRGQLRLRGAVDDKQQAWIARSLARDGLLIEPFVEPLCEFSQHGFVWSGGRFTLGEPCVQQVTSHGTFRNARRAEAGELDDSERLALTSSATRVAQALARADYFGPFGIDAYRYEDRGQPGFCALSEINARYTLGFVAGFGRPACAFALD